MKKRQYEIYFTYGTNVFEFFFIPTVRWNSTCQGVNFMTVDWLRWYVGIQVLIFDEKE